MFVWNVNFTIKFQKYLTKWNVCYRAQLSKCSNRLLTPWSTHISPEVICFDRKVDLTIKFQKVWHLEMSPIWLNFSKCSFVCLLLETLIFRSATMFDRMLIWTSNFRNIVNYEMFVIKLKIGDAQSLVLSVMRRLNFTVVKCFVNRIDLTDQK